MAGLRVDGGGWVRPLAPNTTHGQLYPQHMQLEDGSEPQVLDVVGVDLREHKPAPGQPENWIIGPKPWTLWDRPAPEWLDPVLSAGLDQGPLLLGSKDRSIPATRAASAEFSLALVAPTVVLWQVGKEAEYRPHPRALFRYRDHWYNLPVTDPAWAAVIVRNLKALHDAGKARGHHWHKSSTAGLPSGKLWLTISLGEPHLGQCYKLVAGIVPRDHLPR